MKWKNSITARRTRVPSPFTISLLDSFSVKKFSHRVRVCNFSTRWDKERGEVLANDDTLRTLLSEPQI